MPNTCKSNDAFSNKYPSGERVSNTLVTYPKVWETVAKGLLIPHVDSFQRRVRKGASLWEGPASHQLVGEVMAHQGDDG